MPHPKYTLMESEQIVIYNLIVVTVNTVFSIKCILNCMYRYIYSVYMKLADSFQITSEEFTDK